MDGFYNWFDLIWANWFGLYIGVAYVAIIYRIVTRRFTKAEWVLLAILVLHHALEVFQLWVGDNFTIKQLPNRYFQSIAPLAWGWTAYGLIWLWKWRKDVWGVLAKLVVIGLVAEVIGYECIRKVSHEYRKGTGRDGIVAAKKMAPYILEDYKGPARHENFPYMTREYYTSRRPVIKGDFGRALVAWTVRGQNALPMGPYPLKEDYFVRRLDRYHEEYPELPESQYEVMTEVQGLRYKWRLYRRKDAPGRESFSTIRNFFRSLKDFD